MQFKLAAWGLIHPLQAWISNINLPCWTIPPVSLIVSTGPLSTPRSTKCHPRIVCGSDKQQGPFVIVVALYQIPVHLSFLKYRIVLSISSAPVRATPSLPSCPPLLFLPSTFPPFVSPRSPRPRSNCELQKSLRNPDSDDSVSALQPSRVPSWSLPVHLLLPFRQLPLCSFSFSSPALLILNHLQQLSQLAGGREEKKGGKERQRISTKTKENMSAAHQGQ